MPSSIISHGCRVDRIDTYLTKITAIDRFNNGAIPLLNEDAALTTLFNNFLRYLLDEWVGEPITEQEAPALAERFLDYIRRPAGLLPPSREVIERCSVEDPRIFPLLGVRWLMRNASIRVVIPHLTSEWRDFVGHYGALMSALDVGLFDEPENDQ